jgi:hypothetical protein
VAEEEEAVVAEAVVVEEAAAAVLTRMHQGRTRAAAGINMKSVKCTSTRNRIAAARSRRIPGLAGETVTGSATGTATD